jgi:O-antigen ligase
MTENKTSPYNLTAFGIICCLIVFAPMARGSVHAWAKAVIQLMVVIAWCVLLIETMAKGRRIQFNTPLNRPLAGLTLLVFVSVAASAHPAAAFEGMLMFLTWMALFFLVVNTVRTRWQERGLINVIIGTGMVISIVGILKLLQMSPFPWWDYVVAGRESPQSLTGVYVNRNHMAGFMEMVIPLLLILFVTRQRVIEQKIVLISLTFFFILVQILTLSRGGWISTLGAMLFMGTLLVIQKQVQIRTIFMGITGFLFFVCLFVLAASPAFDRFNTLQQNDPGENIEGRLRAWRGAVMQIRDNPLTGTGPGTFQYAYLAYQVPGHAEFRRYAHNDYLNITAELGLLFVPAAVMLIFQCFRAGFRKLKSRSRQKSGIALGCMAAIFAIMVHSLSDFNLYIPANAVLFTVLSALTVKSEP